MCQWISYFSGFYFRLKSFEARTRVVNFEKFSENLVAMRRMSMAERRSSDGKGLANRFDLKFMPVSNLLELTCLSLALALK